MTPEQKEMTLADLFDHAGWDFIEAEFVQTLSALQKRILSGASEDAAADVQRYKLTKELIARVYKVGNAQFGSRLAPFFE